MKIFMLIKWLHNSGAAEMFMWQKGCCLDD